ncbi:hypothetical protein PILCRDRAFT_821637, partial [Piloderma croceum F 1598]
MAASHPAQIPRPVATSLPPSPSTLFLDQRRYTDARDAVYNIVSGSQYNMFV